VATVPRLLFRCFMVIYMITVTNTYVGIITIHEKSFENEKFIDCTVLCISTMNILPKYFIIHIIINNEFLKIF